MLPIDLRGKRALVAGVADDNGFGWAIAKCLIEAGATVCVATWPPALNIFLNLLERGKLDGSRTLSDGSLLSFEKIYPLDAVFDRLEDAPEELRTSKRYKDVGDFSIGGLAAQLVADFGARVNTISAGPYASRAASAIGIIDRMVQYCKLNTPLPEELSATEVGHTAAFLASPLASGITGSTVYVDKGYHAMGMAVEMPG